MPVLVVAEFPVSVTFLSKYYCVMLDFLLRISEVEILPLDQSTYGDNCNNSAKSFLKNDIIEILFKNETEQN
jgi:hypothetical protein